MDLYLRGRAPAEAVDRLLAVVERARRLEEIDRVSDVTVTTWSSVRPVLETIADGPASVTATVAAFRSWADSEGYSLEPAFRRREVSSMLEAGTGTESHPFPGSNSASDPDTDAFRELCVPTVCAAIYAGETLECVVPCSDDERTYSVEECLQALETGVLEHLPGPMTHREWARGATPDASRDDSDVGSREDTETSTSDG
nr:HTH domain-containing protein [Halobiforma lacisalsi]